MKRVSIKTIAEVAGVSKSAVSFVLNGHGDKMNISPTTQEKIKSVAAELKYKPNQLARSLILGKSNTIGLVVPDISNPFFAKIGLFIEQYANKNGYLVMFASTKEEEEKENKIVDTFIARQVDGLIIAPTTKSDYIEQKLATNRFPTIYIDRINDSLNSSFVDINNEASAEVLAEMLIKKGHEKIGLVSLTSYLPNIRKRIDGYKKALQRYNINMDEELIVDVDFNNKKLGVQQALYKFLHSKTPVTSIIFLNNMLAAEGIWNLNVHFKEFRNRIEFACFDNLDLFDYSSPTVSSIVQPSREIAEKAVEMIIQLIHKKPAQKGVTLKTKLIRR